MRSLLLSLGLMLAMASPSIAASSGPIVAPMQIVDGAAIVTVNFDGYDVTALIDTGAATSVLDTSFAFAHGVKPKDLQPATLDRRTADGVIPDPDLFLGTRRLPGVVVLTRMNSLQGGAEMILGHDSLSQLVVELDFDAGIIRLYPRNSFAAPPGAELLPLKLDANGMLTVPVTVEGGAPIQAMVDTGMSSPMELNQATADRFGVGSRWGLDATARGINTTTTGTMIVLKQVTLSSASLGDVRAMIPSRTDTHFGPIPATVGLGLLRLFHLWIDYDGRRMWLAPRAPQPAPIADLAGDEPICPRSLFNLAPAPRLGLTGKTGDAGFAVSMVTARSRAAALGLKVGDVISSFNGQPPAAFFTVPQAACGPVSLKLADGRTVTLPTADLPVLPTLLEDIAPAKTTPGPGL